MDLLDRYVEELTVELKIDDFNVMEVQRRLPGRRHFWNARLIRHKIKLAQLKRDKINLLNNAASSIHQNATVGVSKPVLRQAAENTPTIQDINRQVQDEEILIEFLEKTEKVFSSMTWDIKNIVELQKLEQL